MSEDTRLLDPESVNHESPVKLTLTYKPKKEGDPVIVKEFECDVLLFGVEKAGELESTVVGWHGSPMEAWMLLMQLSMAIQKEWGVIGETQQKDFGELN
jgi:hypothetical protein